MYFCILTGFYLIISSIRETGLVLEVPLELSLLGYEELLGLWIPFLDSASFHINFGFALGFLEKIIPTFGTF